MILVMRLFGPRDAGKPEPPAGQSGTPPRIRGWLLAYIALLAVLVLHSTALTVASIVIYAHPAAAGMHSFVPLGYLLFYVITNLTLILYAAALFILMRKRRRSAIVNNVIFNLLSVAFLIAWNFTGEKSGVGALVDSAPNLAGAAYMLLSRRVRSTFTIRPRSGSVHKGHSAGSGGRLHPVSGGSSD